MKNVLIVFCLLFVIPGVCMAGPGVELANQEVGGDFVDDVYQSKGICKLMDHGREPSADYLYVTNGVDGKSYFSQSGSRLSDGDCNVGTKICVLGSSFVTGAGVKTDWCWKNEDRTGATDPWVYVSGSYVPDCDTGASSPFKGSPDGYIKVFVNNDNKIMTNGNEPVKSLINSIDLNCVAYVCKVGSEFWSGCKKKTGAGGSGSTSPGFTCTEADCCTPPPAVTITGLTPFPGCSTGMPAVHKSVAEEARKKLEVSAGIKK